MEAEDNKSIVLCRGKEGKLYSLYLTDQRQNKKELHKSRLEIAIEIWFIPLYGKDLVKNLDLNLC